MNNRGGNSQGPMPSRQTWLPHNINQIPRLASTNSQESIISQIPLPYHLPADFHGQPNLQHHAPNPPPQVWAHPPHIPFVPSPLNPQTGFPAQTFAGYSDQFPPPHGYQGQQPNPPQQFMHSYPQSHSTFQGDQYASQVGYQHGNMPYQQSNYISRPSSMLPAPGTFGMDALNLNDGQVNQGYAAGYDSGSSQNTYAPSNVSTEGRPDTYEAFLARRALRTANGASSDRHSQKKGGWRLGSYGVSQAPPPEFNLARSQSQKQDYGDKNAKDRQQPLNPAHGEPGFGRRNKAQASALSSSGISKDAAMQSHQPKPLKHEPRSGQTHPGSLNDASITPLKLEISPTKHTPITARRMGETTPISPALRSRRGQSITQTPQTSQTFKIDPVKGPPPAFWPGGKPPVSTPGDSSPVANLPGLGSSASKSVQTAIATITDPFTTMKAAPQLTAAINRTTNQPLRMTGFGQAKLHTGPVTPIKQTARSNPGGPSRHLSTLCPGGVKPTVEVAFDPHNMPFVEPGRQYLGPNTTGIIRISNIPYSVTRQEIMAYLGRNARLISEAEEPIHIIMDRVTSKTMDAYIEFVDLHEAVNSVNRHEINRAGGRVGRLGERHVGLHIVSHEQLMKDLFPRARNVTWKGSEPIIQDSDPDDKYNTGFKGFVTREELVLLVKHVEAPQRSPFSRDCPQRPFECLISTIVKYPWQMIDNITLGERDMIYGATRDLTQIIVARINDGDEDIYVNSRLLRRLQRAIWNCPGFSESQKDDIAFICNADPTVIGLPPYADHWSVFRAIAAKRDWEQDVILYYMALLREATTSSALITLAERSAITTPASKSFFGHIVNEYSEDIESVTLAEAGRIEWNTIESLLRKVLEN